MKLQQIIVWLDLTYISFFWFVFNIIELEWEQHKFNFHPNQNRCHCEVCVSCRQNKTLSFTLNKFAIKIYKMYYSFILFFQHKHNRSTLAGWDRNDLYYGSSLTDILLPKRSLRNPGNSFSIGSSVVFGFALVESFLLAWDAIIGMLLELGRFEVDGWSNNMTVSSCEVDLDWVFTSFGFFFLVCCCFTYN